MLDSKIVPTYWQPKRAFQGWRYLKGEEAPADLADIDNTLPPKLKLELAELGLL